MSVLLLLGALGLRSLMQVEHLDPDTDTQSALGVAQLRRKRGTRPSIARPRLVRGTPVRIGIETPPRRGESAAVVPRSSPHVRRIVAARVSRSKPRAQPCPRSPPRGRPPRCDRRSQRGPWRPHAGAVRCKLRLEDARSTVAYPVHSDLAALCRPTSDRDNWHANVAPRSPGDRRSPVDPFVRECCAVRDDTDRMVAGLRGSVAGGSGEPRRSLVARPSHPDARRTCGRGDRSGRPPAERQCRDLPPPSRRTIPSTARRRSPRIDESRRVGANQTGEWDNRLGARNRGIENWRLTSDD